MLRHITKLFLWLALFAAALSPAHAGTQYVNSVQQRSVTIASGSLTGTDSPAAPTGTYVLFYAGCNTTAAASNGQAYARLAVNQSTGVITATRGVSGTTTVTCTYSLMDATSALVTSVQQTTMSMTSGTGVDASISAITLADSSVMYEGMSQTLTSQHFDLNTYVVTIKDTTHITGTLINGGSGTTIGGAMIVNWNHAALNSATQQFVKTWTDSSGSSTTVALGTAVNVNNSMTLFGGGGSSNGNTDVREQPTLVLTGTSTVTITIGDTANGNAQQDNGTVVEFVTGVLQTNAQRATTTISASTTGTSTGLAACPTSTCILNWNGFLSATTTNTTHATLLPSVTFTTPSTSTITATLASSGSAKSAGELLNFCDASCAGGGGGFAYNQGSIF